MLELTAKARWHLGVLARRWNARRRAGREEFLLGRFACLGQDVLSVLNTSLPTINVQKGRVDYLLDIAADRRLRARGSRVVSRLERRDVAGLVAQEEAIDFLAPRGARVVFLDSFAELTDQRFRHRREGWSFCCNWSDLKHDATLEAEFEPLGLLDLDELEGLYRRLFAELDRRHPEAPIFFLHFPTTLDRREKFRGRGARISRVVQTLAAEHSHLLSLEVPPEIVHWPKGALASPPSFPYHYARRVYEVFAERIRASGRWPECPPS